MDLISRQDAIEAVSEACFEFRGIFGRCEDALKALPSAEPEPSDVARDIARIIENEIDMRVIAQSERKKGKWIRNDNGTYSCSVCQSWIPEEQHYYARYCLYCGANMRGEEDV